MDSTIRPKGKAFKQKRKSGTTTPHAVPKVPRLNKSKEITPTPSKSVPNAKKQGSSSKGCHQSSDPSNIKIKDKFSEALEFVWKESRRCQVCSKTYDTVDKAHKCLHSHKNSSGKPNFRCYFCFDLFEDTDNLFDHYESKHRHAEGMKVTLLCICCDKKVLYKNVSVHVISKHAVSQKSEKCKSKINNVENLEEKYKNEAWRYDEAKKCHECLKTFLIIPAAMNCLNSHRLLRCNFCFSLFSKADMLFDHYENLHKQGKGKNSVLCEFCGESVTYKAAGNHVINCHLSKFI